MITRKTINNKVKSSFLVARDLLKVFPEQAPARLEQNIPNPFTENTEISYYLPDGTAEAALYIYNMQGSQIANYPVNDTGHGSITINGGELKPGMYFYTLIAGDAEVDTRRMILTE